MEPEAPADLVAAVKARDAPKVEAMLRARPELARSRAPGGLPLLQFALYMRGQDVVKLLMARGAEPSVFEAACMDDAPRVRKLVHAQPALLRATSPDGWTPLHLAAHFGAEKAALELLAAGADLAARSSNANGNTPLHAAAAGGQGAMVKLLLARGAPVDAPDQGAHTALHLAAAAGYADMARALLQAGAQPGARNAEGRTPRDLALARGEDEVAGLLG